MNFGDAIKVMKSGLQVFRTGWNGKGMWIAIQYPDDHSANTLPYIYMWTADSQRVPWLASQTDMLSDDWDVR